MVNHHPQYDGPQKFAAGKPLRVGILYYYPSGRVFSCVICGRRKKEKHLASLADNKKWVVCKSCYEERGYIQVRVAAELPPRKAKAANTPSVDRDLVVWQVGNMGRPPFDHHGL